MAPIRPTPCRRRERAQALAGIARQFPCSTQSHISLIVKGEPRSLRPVIGGEIHWIAREALLTAMRHSRAMRIELELRYCASGVRVRIRDDGCGIDPQALQSGREGHWGLAGMCDRAADIAAKLTVRSRRSAATTVVLKSMPAGELADVIRKVHLKHILEKLGATDRMHAAAIGLRRGIIRL